MGPDYSRVAHPRGFPGASGSVVLSRLRFNVLNNWFETPGVDVWEHDIYTCAAPLRHRTGRGRRGQGAAKRRPHVKPGINISAGMGVGSEGLWRELQMSFPRLPLPGQA